MTRVLVSISPEFLNEVDSLASAEHRTRSEFIREALRSYIRRNKQQANIGKYKEAANLLDTLLD